MRSVHLIYDGRVTVPKRRTLSRGALFNSWKEEKRYDAKILLKERHSTREAGIRFSVRESCVRDWSKVNNKHTELPLKRCRQSVGGRRA